MVAVACRGGLKLPHGIGLWTKPSDKGSCRLIQANIYSKLLITNCKNITIDLYIELIMIDLGNIYVGCVIA
ncbi:MAG: hypothetical protein QNJ63_17330 [Calothrix sp. MO_192.B10]|nr:hypothetical protein [Calothrix sp. MO_192.B10]